MASIKHNFSFSYFPICIGCFCWFRREAKSPAKIDCLCQK